MGVEACLSLSQDSRFIVVGKVSRSGGEGTEQDILAACERERPHVLVDLSHASVAIENAQAAATVGSAVVTGVTGHSEQQLQDMIRIATQRAVPILLAPNFAIGAVLMMRFAAIAAKWIPDVEIIEMHHDRKEDAPSGTALQTAKGIIAARTLPVTPRPSDVEKLAGARGGEMGEVHLHSVRLPGLLAHQTVVFGGPGEVLTIRHDAMSRSVYMNGLKLCILKVRELDGFVVGMDHLLFSEGSA